MGEFPSPTVQLPDCQLNWEALKKFFPNLGGTSGSGGASLGIPSVRVYNSVAQAIVTGVITTLNYDSERWDTDSMHSAAVNPGRLTCRTPGLYDVWANVEFNAPLVANTVRIVGLSLNGNPGGFAQCKALVRTDVQPVGVTFNPQITTTWRMNAGDWFEVIVLQGSGANLNMNPSTAANAYVNEFAMAWRGP